MPISSEPLTSAAIASAGNRPLAGHSHLERRLFLVLGAMALIYAFLAGLATVGDPDLGWQLATGRWIAQHHSIFSTDVFSYTMAGKFWIYPAGSALILYAIYVLGGYALISVLGAAACLATVALLLRRGSVVTAALAIVAVPFVAFRAVPRAELFGIVLFAAYLSVLWQYHQTSRARLWLLPVLMVVWINCHLGFFSGLGLILAFGGMDVLELPFSGERRMRAIERLKHGTPWLLATAAATLVNPWGWKFYPALIHHLKGISHQLSNNEWASLHWNWTALESFTLRNTNDLFLVLVAITAVAILAACLQRNLGAAVLLLAALFEAARHVRMVAPAMCVIVVVGGSVLHSALQSVASRIPSRRMRWAIAAASVAMFVALAALRSIDLITNYHSLAERNLTTFGVGLGWWFPQQAAEFVQTENLPRELLNTFNEGGYILWALSPRYRDYIDGRAIPFGEEFPKHGGQLLITPLDSALWQQEADRYGINTILFPLTMDEISLERLKQDCNSREWRPVYLDEVSIVLVRRKPENEDLIRRLGIDCATAPLPRQPLPLSAASFNRWINAARVLSALGRNAEALSAANQALAVFPDNAHQRWYRGQILYALQRDSEAEEDWQTALALAPREVTPWAPLADFQANVWSSLAELYHRQQRSADAKHALEAVIRLTSDPSTKLQARANLGALYLETGETSEAEKQWLAALAIDPGESAIWLSLADSYQRSGRVPQAIHAMQEGIRLSSNSSGKSEAMVKLARLYLISHQPAQALQTLDEAARTAPPELLAASTGRSFSFNVAQGRAAICMAMGDLKQATTFAEQAVQLDPDAPDAWALLAKLYQHEGRLKDQVRADQHSKLLREYSPKF